MSSKVVLLISILCLIKCTWCGYYGLGLGKRQKNDELIHEVVLTKEAEDIENVIKYTYIAEKPVSYVRLRTDANIYTEVTLFISYINLTLSNFESRDFNATFSVYGFPWHPGPGDNIQLLIQPQSRKVTQFTNHSAEDIGSIIRMDVNEHKSALIERASTEAFEIDESGITTTTSSYYEYIDESEEEREVQSIIDVIQNIVVKNESIVSKFNFFTLLIISLVRLVT